MLRRRNTQNKNHNLLKMPVQSNSALWNLSINDWDVGYGRGESIMTSAKFIFWCIIIIISIYCSSPGFSQERTIKPGDAIEIIFSEHESLSQTVLVNPDGMVDYPALQGLPVDGMTLQRFHEVLITQLSRYLASIPLVLVRFSESYPIKVTVLGQVLRPGLYTIPNTATLQGAIGAAGGFIPGGQLSRIKIIRPLNDTPNELIVNMEKFFIDGDPFALPSLKDKDTIVVPGNPLVTNVKVLGCVENPGNFEVFFKTTILDVIYLAGGTTDDANLNRIKIISFTGAESREIVLNMKSLIKAKNFSDIPIVVPGDVVYVPKKFLNWKHMVSLIKDVTTIAMLYYIIVRSKNS